MIFVKSSPHQKFYSYKLKQDIRDAMFFAKKRYDAIPWKKLNTIKKIIIGMNDKITIDDEELTILDAFQKIKNIKSKLLQAQKSSYYDKIYHDFIINSKKKSQIEVENIYKKQNDVLNYLLNDLKIDLHFMLKVIKEINKLIKSYNTPVTEGVDEMKPIENMIMESFDDPAEYEEFMMEYALTDAEDIFYNKTKYEQGDTNICFITGYSGGGKTTISNDEKGFAREVVDMDRIVLHMYREDSYFKKLGNFAYSFAIGPGKKYRIDNVEDTGNSNLSEKFRRGVSKDLVDFARVYANKNKRIRLVLEGVWIYRYIEPSEIDDCAVYIKGTSVKTSTERALKRGPNPSDTDDNDTKKHPFRNIGYVTAKFFYASKDIINGRMSKFQKYFQPKYEKQKHESVKQFKKLKNNVKHAAHDLNDIRKDVGKDVGKAFKKIKKTFKESEDFDMFECNEVVESLTMPDEVKSFLLKMYEEECEDDYADLNEEEVVEEGANLQARRVFKDAQRNIKILLKAGKKYIKNYQYSKAKDTLKKAKEECEKCIKAIDATDNDSIGSFVFGLLTAGAVLPRFWRMLAISLIPVIGTTANSIITLAQQCVEICNKCSKEGFSIDAINLYKNTLKSEIRRYMRAIDICIKNVNEKEKIFKTESKKIAKVEKLAKESAEYTERKYEIYEACQAGEITIEEREELLHDLRNEFFFNENTFDEMYEDDDDYMPAQEKYEAVKLSLYQKCEDGEITIEEREELIKIAYDKIFVEFGEAAPQQGGGAVGPGAPKKGVMSKITDAVKTAYNAATKGPEAMARKMTSEVNNEANKLQKDMSMDKMK